jgi:outer membrane biosynthesis protein TonB
VSKEPPHGASKIEPSNGGGAGKWLLGGLAAVVLVGGGYAAWKTMSPQQDRSQFAYNDEYADEYGADPLRAGPLESDEHIVAESASADDGPAPAPASARSTPAPRATTGADEAVPEATFGITPISATNDDADAQDIVVTAPRQPVWARTPSTRRLSTMYPQHALEAGREGEASLHCMVEVGGSLDCQRVEETPGFGPAAMRVARSLRHAPTRADGANAAGTPVNLRVVFRIADTRRS